MQLGGLLEGGSGSAPTFVLRMALPGLPLPEGLHLGTRRSWRALGNGNGQGHEGRAVLSFGSA
jgi:hypothetical protein